MRNMELSQAMTCHYLAFFIDSYKIKLASASNLFLIFCHPGIT